MPTASKQGEKVVIIQGEQGCELQLQEIALAGLTGSGRTLTTKVIAVPWVHTHTMYLMGMV